MTVSRNPHKARPRDGVKDGWWYENEKSIDVYIQPTVGPIFSVRISRAPLADWIKRTEGGLR